MDSCLRDGLAHTGGRGFAVLLAPHGDIAVNMTAIQDLEIVFGAIPRIRRQLSSLSARVKPDLLQHWLELMRVAGQVCQSLRHDHLVIGIDSCLGVIALDKSVPRLHDATVWIGEIVLGAVVGGAGRMCRRAVRRVLALLRLLPYRVLCVGFQFRFRGADLLQAVLLGPHPIRQFVPALVQRHTPRLRARRWPWPQPANERPRRQVPVRRSSSGPNSSPCVWRRWRGPWSHPMPYDPSAPTPPSGITGGPA